MDTLKVFTSRRYQESIKRIAAEIPIDEGRILVTGASGLIGSCVTDVFAEANRSYGKHFAVYALGRNEERLRARFDHCRGVICLAQDIAKPIEIEGIQYIIHAASNADPKSYALYPAETIRTNLLGAMNVLDYSRKWHSRALLTSTFEVYGQSDQDCFSETDYGKVDIDMVRSCYPESKRAAEVLFKSYHAQYGADCVIARLTSAFGPTMLENDSKAQAQFLRNALRGDNIVLKSSGSQRRSYSYVMDVVSGILFLLFNGKSGESYNIANDNSVASIAEVAEAIAELAGVDVIYGAPDEIEKKGFSKPQNIILKADKINQLGWFGKYDLSSGLRETYSILEDSLEV